MTDRLPPNLLKLFAPRPPLPYLRPLDRDVTQRTGPRISGVSQYTSLLKDYDKDYIPTLTLEEKRKLKMMERQKRTEIRIKSGLESWNPKEDSNIKSDPYKTIIVARLNYEVTEKDMRRAFDYYGEIKSIRIVRDESGKPRGYAFVEFERESDMKAAYHDADGMKILGRRIVVDVERGRTVKGWRPRRLGGGLGRTRVGNKYQNQKNSGRDPSLLRKEGRREGHRYEQKDRGNHRDRYQDRFRGERDRSDRFSHRRRHRSRSGSPRGRRRYR